MPSRNDYPKKPLYRPTPTGTATPSKADLALAKIAESDALLDEAKTDPDVDLEDVITAVTNAVEKRDRMPSVSEFHTHIHNEPSKPDSDPPPSSGKVSVSLPWGIKFRGGAVVVFATMALLASLTVLGLSIAFAAGWKP